MTGNNGSPYNGTSTCCPNNDVDEKIFLSMRKMTNSLCWHRFQDIPNNSKKIAKVPILVHNISLRERHRSQDPPYNGKQPKSLYWHISLYWLQRLIFQKMPRNKFNGTQLYSLDNVTNSKIIYHQQGEILKHLITWSRGYVLAFITTYTTFFFVKYTLTD